MLAVGLVAVKLVVMKMLPFDNKSEFQVIVNLPRGHDRRRPRPGCSMSCRMSSSEFPKSAITRPTPARRRRSTSMGSCASITCAQDPSSATLQVNLVDKHHRTSQEPRDRARRAAGARRHRPQATALPCRSWKFHRGRRCSRRSWRKCTGRATPSSASVAQDVRELFDTTADIVDIDDSLEAPAPRLIVDIDRQKAACSA